MKIVKILSFTALFLSNSNLNSQTIKNPLKIDFEIIGTSWCNDYNDYYSENYNKTYSSLYGELCLTNQTDSDLAFWIITCSWTDLFIIEPDSIFLDVKECNVNKPKRIFLSKGQSIIFYSIIDIPYELLKQSINKTNKEDSFNTFKIGFIYIQEKDYYVGINWRELIEENHKKKNYIWSNPINIRFSKYEWKIK